MKGSVGGGKFSGSWAEFKASRLDKLLAKANSQGTGRTPMNKDGSQYRRDKPRAMGGSVPAVHSTKQQLAGAGKTQSQGPVMTGPRGGRYRMVNGRRVYGK